MRRQAGGRGLGGKESVRGKGHRGKEIGVRVDSGRATTKSKLPESAGYMEGTFEPEPSLTMDAEDCFLLTK